MKHYLLFFIFLIFSISSWAQEECYELVWSDEFDYNGAPNPDKWGYDIGGNGWGNNEDQYYTDRLENAQVSGGKLKITARKENFGGKQYTSARVVSKNKGDWLYGKIEVRAKLPTGQGTWPAIWMLPTDWEYGGWPASGEIDIMEHVGYDQNVVHATVHTEAFNHSIGTQVGKSITDADVSNVFHTYKLEWTEDKIRVSLDETEYFVFGKQGSYKEWPFDKRFHLLLNIAMGGNWGGVGGPTDDTKLPTSMEIDYVRVYQNVTPEITISGPSVVQKLGTAKFTAKGAIGEVSWTIPEGAEIINGEDTNEITVQFGDEINTSSIKASITGQCAVYSSTFDFSINEGIPSQDQIYFNALNSESQINWEVDENNIFQIDLSSDDSLACVNFDVEDPSSNPRVNYYFDNIYDLSSHNSFTVNLKFGNSLAPEMLRFDLIDINGNVLSGDFLERNYTELKDDCNVWTISHQFDNSKIELSEVAGVRMYVNYGIFSTPKRGGFQIGTISFSKEEIVEEQLTNDQNCGCIDDIPLSVDRFLSTPIYLYPNPISEGQTLKLFGDIFHKVEIFDLQGRKLYSIIELTNNEVILPNLYKGTYIVRAYSNRKNHTLRLVKI